jgi:hypothetical protein
VVSPESLSLAAGGPLVLSSVPLGLGFMAGFTTWVLVLARLVGPAPPWMVSVVFVDPPWSWEVFVAWSLPAMADPPALGLVFAVVVGPALPSFAVVGPPALAFVVVGPSPSLAFVEPSALALGVEVVVWGPVSSLGALAGPSALPLVVVGGPAS